VTREWKFFQTFEPRIVNQRFERHQHLENKTRTERSFIIFTTRRPENEKRNGIFKWYFK